MIGSSFWSVMVPLTWSWAVSPLASLLAHRFPNGYIHKDVGVARILEDRVDAVLPRRGVMRTRRP
jgi:hypothetical protein